MSGSALALLLAAAGALSTAALPYGHPSPGKNYPKRPGFTLWLVEEFDSPLDLNSDPIWTWSDGGLHEGQVRFVKNAVKFGGGKMRLEARTQRQPGSCSHAEVGHVPEKGITSGELRTRHNMFRYGYYEVRMRAPSVRPGNPNINGNFISSMFVFRTAKFRHWREIDIELTGGTAEEVHMNVLSADNTHYWRPSMQASQARRVNRNLRTAFHTLAFKWLPSGITWYFDGQPIGFHGPGGLPIPDMSVKIMMNLWILRRPYGFGGRHGWNNRYPMYGEYDWFRFYKWDGDHHYPCADAGGSCLSHHDRFLSSNNPCDGVQQAGGPVPCLGRCWAGMAMLNQMAATAAANQSRAFYP